MKKLSLIVIVCLLLLSLAACGDTVRFKNEEALMAHLNGMWVVDDFDSGDYYIFYDGQIYHTFDSIFAAEVEQIMQSIYEKDGITAWAQLDFQTILDSLTTEGIIRSPIANVHFEVQKGTVIFDKDSDNEHHIVITEDAVLLRYADEDDSSVLIRFADQTDFSNEKFEQLFMLEKEKFSVSASQFLDTYEEYEAKLRKYHPEINNWVLAEDSGNSKIYTADGKLNSDSACIMIAKDGISLMNGNSANRDIPDLVKYSPGSDGYDVMIHDTHGTDLMRLFRYFTMAVEDLPGVLNATELYDLFLSDSSVSNGMRYLKNVKLKSVTYWIYQSSDEKNTTIYATVNDKIKLGDFVQLSQMQDAESIVPDVSESTTQVVSLDTIPVQPEPTTQMVTTDTTIPPTESVSRIPYTTHLSATQPIYSAPDINSRYVQTVGESTIYTIVEEAYDIYGNLWGKLKSGLGWVMLESVNAFSAQPAPMSKVPYTIPLSATVPIYSAPDGNSRYVQAVGENGIYTIVEESYDNYGNLWGKLKSGLGWVKLSSVY